MMEQGPGGGGEAGPEPSNHPEGKEGHHDSLTLHGQEQPTDQ